MLARSLQNTPLLLHRPRVIRQLEKALEYPLTTIIGEKGAGKTTALKQFFEQSDPVVIWHTATKLDSLPAHFRVTLLQAIRETLPTVADAMERSPARSGILELADCFLSNWRTHTEDIPAIYLVLDSFERNEWGEVHTFLRHLLEARVPNLHLIILSTRREDMSLHDVLARNAKNCITAEDLAFSPSEIAELLRQRNVLHMQSHVDRILEATDGWPIAVDDYARQLETPPEHPQIDAVFDPTECFHLIQGEAFASYSMEIRVLLAKLALLPSFSEEIVRDLATGDLPATIQTLRMNPFIRLSTPRRLTRYQATYRLFLSQQTVILRPEEIDEVYRSAGEWFLAKGHTFEAIECFGRSHQHERVFEALMQYSKSQWDRKIAFYAKRFIEDLPESFYEAHPLMHVMVANLKMGTNRLEEAEVLLHALAEKYEAAEGTEENRQILGEVYLSLAELQVMLTESGIHYLRKAYDLLPNGSRFHCEDRHLTGNDSVIFMLHCESGDLQRMDSQFTQMQPYLDRLYGRFIKGFPELYSAEVALALGDRHRALDKASAAFRIGRLNERHDIVCNAFTLMAQLAPLTGGYQELFEIATSISEYIEERGLVSLRTHVDYLTAWIYLKLRALDRVPQRIQDIYAFSERPGKELTVREMIIHCTYWVEMGEYQRALAMISIAQHRAQLKYLWVASITLHILEAICYNGLGATEKSLQAHYRAYQMAYPAKITMPFIEAGRHMRTLINAVSRQDKYVFDKAWLSHINTKANSYAKRISTIIHQYEKSEKTEAPVKLSSREQEVLDLLTGGLTRDEISERLGITIHGVKRHITSLYNKLGAANRSDAIRTAVSLGLVR